MPEAKPIGRGHNISHEYVRVDGYTPPIYVPACNPASHAYTEPQLLFRDTINPKPSTWNRRCPACFNPKEETPWTPKNA